jgi:hypothetical protein
MKDEDVTCDEEMCFLELRLHDFPIGPVVDKWFPLTPFPGVKIGGEIHLRLQIAIPIVTPFAEYTLPRIKGQEVFRIRVIAAKDFERLKKFGNADPFVIVNCGGMINRTNVKLNTGIPRWDEEFEYLLEREGDRIVTITLMDKNDDGNQKISMAELLVSILPFGKVLDVWIELSEERKGEKPGKVHVLLHFARNGSVRFRDE